MYILYLCMRFERCRTGTLVTEFGIYTHTHTHTHTRLGTNPKELTSLAFLALAWSARLARHCPARASKVRKHVCTLFTRRGAFVRLRPNDRTSTLCLTHRALLHVRVVVTVFT